MEESEIAAGDWKSGELFPYYHDWLFHKNEEIIFACNSSGIPHHHCRIDLIQKPRQFHVDCRGFSNTENLLPSGEWFPLSGPYAVIRRQILEFRERFRVSWVAFSPSQP